MVEKDKEERLNILLKKQLSRRMYFVVPVFCWNIIENIEHTKNIITPYFYQRIMDGQADKASFANL